MKNLEYKCKECGRIFTRSDVPEAMLNPEMEIAELCPQKCFKYII